MDEHDIEPVQPEALQAVLDGPADAVASVVEVRRFGGRAERKVLAALVVAARGQQLADLRREDEGVARLARQDAAEAAFGESEAVPGRNVEIADPGIPRGGKRRLGLLVGRELELVADRNAAEAGIMRWTVAGGGHGHAFRVRVSTARQQMADHLPRGIEQDMAGALVTLGDRGHERLGL